MGSTHNRNLSRRSTVCIFSPSPRTSFFHSRHLLLEPFDLFIAGDDRQTYPLAGSGAVHRRPPMLNTRLDAFGHPFINTRASAVYKYASPRTHIQRIHQPPNTHAPRHSSHLILLDCFQFHTRLLFFQPAAAMAPRYPRYRRNEQGQEGPIVRRRQDRLVRR